MLDEHLGFWSFPIFLSIALGREQSFSAVNQALIKSIWENQVLKHFLWESYILYTLYT